MSHPKIEVRNLTISFDGVSILKNVSFSVESGKALVFIGPSGSGKTTLLKTICGLSMPQAGDILVDNLNLYKCSSEVRAEKMQRIGMLFQKNALFDSFTCGENIAFPLREVTSLSEIEIGERVDYFLEAVGIPHAKLLYPDEISGGMQKRLGIARALALEPEIILYDDPTAGLDPITSKKIIQLILELKQKNNSTVLAVTNDMGRAYQLADRIGMVVDHEFLMTGSPKETKQHADLRVQQFIKGETTGPLNVMG